MRRQPLARTIALHLCTGAFCAAMALLGCIGAPQHPAATQPATISDAATTQPAYWYDRPASITVDAANFDRLVAAGEDALRDFDFAIDRVDYRSGLISSQPLISAQFFEFWRKDVPTVQDSAVASTATMRRTVHLQIDRTPGGGYELAPKVLVERQAMLERRISSVVLYKGSFNRVAPRDLPRGSKEADEGIIIPSKYWYAVGRDEALEKKLADDIGRRLKANP